MGEVRLPVRDSGVQWEMLGSKRETLRSSGRGWSSSGGFWDLVGEAGVQWETLEFKSHRYKL